MEKIYACGSFLRKVLNPSDCLNCLFAACLSWILMMIGSLSTETVPQAYVIPFARIERYRNCFKVYKILFYFSDPVYELPYNSKFWIWERPTNHLLRSDFLSGFQYLETHVIHAAVFCTSRGALRLLTFSDMHHSSMQKSNTRLRFAVITSRKLKSDTEKLSSYELRRNIHVATLNKTSENSST